MRTRMHWHVPRRCLSSRGLEAALCQAGTLEEPGIWAQVALHGPLAYEQASRGHKECTQLVSQLLSRRQGFCPLCCGI